MQEQIREWDSCKPIDVSGAKFSYTFIPTGIGLVIEVKCDVCKRKLSFSDF
ncbi:hypothetical protein NLX74_24840 [Paenibacillus sp. MZ03-122A]|nr:hypothetical protein [Paenibacillus sp. MZ03-122A]